jgi:hypothetical protein
MTKLFTKHDLNANYLHASPALELKLAGDKAAEGTIERLVSNYLSFRVRRRSRMRLMAR